MSASQETLLVLADLLDAAPGSTGTGLTEVDRAAIYSVVVDPNETSWRNARRVHVTKNDLLYVAVLHHTNTTLLEIPTTEQIITALEHIFGKRESVA